MPNKITLITLCSGYDSQQMALDILTERHPGTESELLAWSEIDEPAITMHNLVYPQYSYRNLGDMTKIDWNKEKVERGWPQDIDLLTYSTPCQSISQAGKQDGLTEGSGTRSAILWSTEDAIRSLKPRFLMQENVSALVSKKFLPEFHKWCERVQGYGYRNFVPPIFKREDGTNTKNFCINAKDMGVPQNRERVYMVSIREDVYQEMFADKQFYFPAPQPLDIRLEDVLEEDVDIKHFLKDEQVCKFLTVNDKEMSKAEADGVKEAVSSNLFIHTHENVDHATAMFIKTYYHRWFRENISAWNMNKDELSSVLEKVSECMPKDCDPKAMGEEFEREWEYNMQRKPGDPEFWEMS